MVNKNKGKGGKKRRRCRNTNEISRTLVRKEEGQEYAKIIKPLGACRFMALFPDNQERLCIIRGSMRKRIWIHEDDIVLVGLRDFQDDKADIIHKYTLEDKKMLIRTKKLPDIFSDSAFGNVDDTIIIGNPDEIDKENAEDSYINFDDI